MSHICRRIDELERLARKPAPPDADLRRLTDDELSELRTLYVRAGATDDGERADFSLLSDDDLARAEALMTKALPA
jgi:hypothetical protein